MTCRCCSLPGIPLAPGTPPPQQRAGRGERPEWDGLSLGSRIGRAAKANSFLPGSPGLSALPPPPPQICLSAEQKSRNCLRDPRMRFLAQMKSSAVAARRELTPGRELEGYS